MNLLGFFKDPTKFFISTSSMARNIFVGLMLIYTLFCLIALTYKIGDLAFTGEILNFSSLRHVLADALFTLIIIAIVKTLFISNGFDYAVTFLEIGFVVILRKLILIEILPEELGLIIALGGISAVFFILILILHKFKRDTARIEYNQSKQNEQSSSK